MTDQVDMARFERVRKLVDTLGRIEAAADRGGFRKVELALALFHAWAEVVRAENRATRELMVDNASAELWLIRTGLRLEPEQPS